MQGGVVILATGESKVIHYQFLYSTINSYADELDTVVWLIHFYFHISSISTLMLTYYDAWYCHNALHELCKPSQLLTLNI